MLPLLPSLPEFETYNALMSWRVSRTSTIDVVRAVSLLEPIAMHKTPDLLVVSGRPPAGRSGADQVPDRPVYVQVLAVSKGNLRRRAWISAVFRRRDSAHPQAPRIPITRSRGFEPRAAVISPM